MPKHRGVLVNISDACSIGNVYIRRSLLVKASHHHFPSLITPSVLSKYLTRIQFSIRHTLHSLFFLSLSLSLSPCVRPSFCYFHWNLKFSFRQFGLVNSFSNKNIWKSLPLPLRLRCVACAILFFSLRIQLLDIEKFWTSWKTNRK